MSESVFIVTVGVPAQFGSVEGAEESAEKLVRYHGFTHASVLMVPKDYESSMLVVENRGIIMTIPSELSRPANVFGNDEGEIDG